MEHVRRWDAGTVGKVKRTDQGYLRCDATITRIGVFPYKQPGGKIRRELRLPEEVFNADSLESFGISPLTNGHPRKPNGEPIMLTSKNTARYQVGSVTEPRQDGDAISAVVQITDDDAIRDAENGKRQLSCGYDCQLERTPGVTSGIDGIADGLRYDAIQRNIRGNHVALVTKGRAGEAVQLRMDDADAYQVDESDSDQPESTNHKETATPAAGVEPMETKITVDGVDYECTPQVEQAVKKLMARIDDAETVIADFKKFHEQEKARADTAEEALAAEKQAREDAADPAKLKEAVAERLKLERAASPILGDEVKLDDMADGDIKAAVVVAVAKDKDLAKERIDGCEDTYLQARFDAAIDAWQEGNQPNEGLAAARKAGRAVSRTDEIQDARARMVKHNQEIGRKAFN